MLEQLVRDCVESRNNDSMIMLSLKWGRLDGYCLANDYTIIEDVDNNELKIFDKEDNVLVEVTWNDEFREDNEGLGNDSESGV